MRTHTQDFKTKIKEYGRQFNDTIYYNNNTYDGERINSVNYSVDTSLMRSVMQTLKIDTDIPVAKGDTLDYGISLEGVTGSEIRFNNFIVDKVEDQKDKNSKLVTCYDNMLKTMKEYENPGVTYPVTVRYYINAICTHLGITFKNASSTFTNYNKQITSEHYVDTDGNSLGYTFRDVLDDLAEATGSFICIDNTGKLEIRSITNTNDTIDEEYFKDKNVTVGEKYGPINVVILSRGDDSDNLVRPTGTLPDPKTEIKIADNPILDQDNREDFIDGIYNQLNGLEFYLNNLATNGILYYEVGDKFNVSIDQTTYPCLLLADNIKRTTGLSEKIYTKEPSKSVTDYKYASDTDKLEKTSRNAWIKANKAEGSIEQIVSAVGDNGEVTTASIVQSINDSGSQIKLNADKVYINGVTFDENQNMTMTDGTIALEDNPETEVIPSISITTENNSNSKIGIWSTRILSGRRYGDYTSSNKYVEGYYLRHIGTSTDLQSYLHLGRFREYGTGNYEGIRMYHMRRYDGEEYSFDTNHTAIEIFKKGDNDPVVSITEKEARIPKIFASNSVKSSSIIAGFLESQGSSLLSGDTTMGGDLTLTSGDITLTSGDLYSNAIDMYNDTSGTDWKTLLKNKLDYCVDNINTSKTNAQVFINGGWSGVMYGFGIFSKINISGIGTTYQLMWISQDGIYYCIKSSAGVYTYKKQPLGDTYSRTETLIGTWVDGKPLYRKTIDFGALPNNTEKQVSTGLTGCQIVKMYGTATYTSNNATQVPIPYVDCSNLANSMTLIARDYGTKIGIKTAINYSAFSAEVVLEYTKNSD